MFIGGIWMVTKESSQVKEVKEMKQSEEDDRYIVVDGRTIVKLCRPDPKKYTSQAYRIHSTMNPCVWQTLKNYAEIMDRKRKKNG
jgi:hypothetical protein